MCAVLCAGVEEAGFRCVHSVGVSLKGAGRRKGPAEGGTKTVRRREALTATQQATSTLTPITRFDASTCMCAALYYSPLTLNSCFERTALRSGILMMDMFAGLSPTSWV